MPRDESSYIIREGTTPQTRSVIASRIKIFSYSFGSGRWTQIGVCGSFNHSDARSVDPVRGIGFGDQIAELVPGVSDPVSLSLERTALYLSSMFQVLGYAGGIDGLVRALKHHRWPFDIRQDTAISELSLQNAENVQGKLGSVGVQGGALRTLVTIFEGCWMNSFSTSFTSDTSIVTESTDITVHDISDGRSVYNEFIPSGNQPKEISGAFGGGGIGSILHANGSTQRGSTSGARIQQG